MFTPLVTIWANMENPKELEVTDQPEHPQTGPAYGAPAPGMDPRQARAQVKAEKAFAKATRPWWKKKRVWLGAVLLLVVIGAFANLNKTSDPSGAAPASGGTAGQPAAPQKPAEPPIEVTAAKLLADLDANSLAAAETYNGKMVKVTGTLSVIDSSGKYFSLKGDKEFSLQSIRVDIKPEHQAAVKAFKKEQKVTVTGKVKDVGEIIGYAIQADTIG